MHADKELKVFLEGKVNQYNTLDFITLDPVAIPHAFTRKEDIEIAGLLTASIAWGNRKAILKSARQLMAWMDNEPYDFVMHASPNEWSTIGRFIYRTFNGTDARFFLDALKNIYTKHGGLEAVFTRGYQQDSTIKSALQYFRQVFLSVPHQIRSEKHVASPAKGSSAKRLNMYLRWMVRHDAQGVDFGLWKHIPASALMIPLDVHSGTQARNLGLLLRKQNDWKAVEALTETLRGFDPADPVKYDFALFGMGVNKEQ
ncbi:MAG: TIGR02757 family protein [Salinivirgaceae bacterium]